MDAEPTTNLFFALPVPDGVRALAGRVQEQVRQSGAPARLPGLEGLHVTLAFLGPTAAGQVPELLRLAAAAAGGSGFTLDTAGIGGFPRPHRARILWLGFAAQPELADLAERLRRALASAGATFDPKPFQAHLTLARFREPVDLDRMALEVPLPIRFSVRDFALWQTVPTPHGSRYRPLGTIDLGGA